MVLNARRAIVSPSMNCCGRSDMMMLVIKRRVETTQLFCRPRTLIVQHDEMPVGTIGRNSRSCFLYCSFPSRLASFSVRLARYFIA